MECDGQDNGKCYEKCICYFDNGDVFMVDIKKVIICLQNKRGYKKFLYLYIGFKEMNKMKCLFMKWMKEYGVDGYKVK